MFAKLLGSGTASATHNLLLTYRALHGLINLTYFWPQKGVDTPSQIALIQGEDKSDYHAQLLAHVKSYLNCVNKSVKGARSRDDRLQVDKLDKPNVHRLLELYVHTLPAFGHARQISELLFERAHQPLKRIWEGHNPFNLHYAMVREILYDDLFDRLYLAQELYRRCPPEDKRFLENHLSSLLFGRRFNEDQYDDNFDEICTKMKSILLLPAARGLLRGRFRAKTVSSKSYPWKARVAMENLPPTWLERRASIDALLREHNLTSTPPRLFTYAKRGTNPFNRVRAGDAFQVLMRGSDINIASSGRMVPARFCIISLSFLFSHLTPNKFMPRCCNCNT